MTVVPVAHIHTAFPEKFGIPRQSGLSSGIARIVFTPEYRRCEAVRGLEEFSHLWLLWQFSACAEKAWTPTVRPPRLGGNRRVGVFATRSPFRPNHMGLSSVRLEKIDLSCPHAPVLLVSGADMLDGTPIYDIKPYLAFTDCHPDAVGGFADRVQKDFLHVVCAEECRETLPQALRRELISVLEQDPRPHYQNDPGRIYGMYYGAYHVRFTVSGDTLTVIFVQKE